MLQNLSASAMVSLKYKVIFNYVDKVLVFYLGRDASVSDCLPRDQPEKAESPRSQNYSFQKENKSEKYVSESENG